MNYWKKLRNMKIPGYIKVASLMGVILGITTGLFISLPVKPQDVDILEENISGKNESLELVITTPEEELRVKVTGENIMEVVQNLKGILKSMEDWISVEKY